MEQQIKLIEEMIAENPDSTIKDFREMLNDIESVEVAALAVPLIKVQNRNKNGRFDGNILIPAFKLI